MCREFALAISRYIVHMAETDSEFSEQYAKAKRCQVELLVDEILEIADDSSQDNSVNDQGNIAFNAERVARSRLRIDTRKWIACKLIPRVYGAKPDDSTHISHEERLKMLQEIADIQESYNREY